MRRRRVFLMLGVLALAVMLIRHPSADLRIITHDITDPAPRRLEAALDMGVFAMSLIVTWTARSIAVR